jgi:trans-L-3-hydroxyproline dehydratase
VYKENISIPMGERRIAGHIAFGGAFYVYVNAAEIGLAVEPGYIDQFIRTGMEIKEKVSAEHQFVHPTEPGIDWLYGTIFLESVRREGKTLVTKNVCIFADGQVDRSPTGTGTGGRVALLAYQGIMQDDDILINRSIIDTTMEARIIEHVRIGEYPAVIAEVGGTAFITGFNQLVLDSDDPLPEGFRL